MQIVAGSLLKKTTNIVWGRTICKLLCTHATKLRQRITLVNRNFM